MIEHHIIADDGRFAYYYTCTMVDKEAFPDLRTWMNFNAARNETSELRDKARQERNMRLVEGMSDAVVKDGP